MPTVLRALLLAVLLTFVPVAVGVLLAGGPTAPAPPPPAYTGTDLADYDATAVAVARADFCSRIVAEAVTEALGKEAGKASAYANGDRVQVDGSRDVVHEYGCSYRAGRGRAEGWVFAPPVTAARARELASARPGDGCRRVADAPALGGPSSAVLCPGESATLTYAGLIGDAWLTCRLTLPGSTPEQELTQRAGRWCVAVAKAAAVS
ncbi:hypothetical protein E8D34_10485 [Nocardioides sp. GY 10113]|uniref:hypothetical protein n=1 Tax=Nocardioides sp. GY 10113 TaxID=2569761 RepID=UPI0010A78A88|nr:hypothetical protein [Nocardioides sp. GY 10113]TIC87531.1 hypothetical protein E8D34_10485 [Nocardioides sp. GY 10113]